MKRMEETPQHLSLDLFDYRNDLWKNCEDGINYTKVYKIENWRGGVIFDDLDDIS